jgi:toluene monooxygenase system protein B
MTMGNPMPIVSLFRGDFLYNLVLVEDTDTIAEAAAKCAEHSVGRRVIPQNRALQVEHGGAVLDRTSTVGAAGVVPMSELIVSYVGGSL